MKPFFNSPVPHVLLPALMFISLYVPPFPRRVILFATAIILTVACNTFNAYPPDRMMRYGLAGSWLFYIPVLEKLLCHSSPEHDFWRVDRPVREAEQMKPWSYEKARWAFALWATPRGVGWNHASSKLPRVRNPNEPTGMFLVKRMVQGLVFYMMLELVVIIADRAGEESIPREFSCAERPMILVVEMLMASTVCSSYLVQTNALAAVTVAMGLCKPKDWPPFFGNLWDVTTVGDFWGRFWHTLLKHPALGFSHRIVSHLHLLKRSILTYAIHLGTGFVLSTVGHILNVLPIAEGYYSLAELSKDSAIFFMGQAAAIVAETAVIGLYRKRRKRREENMTEKGLQKRAAADGIWTSLVGYVWVASWLAFSGWWFVKLYTRIGVLKWQVPIPVAERLLRWADML